MIFNHTNGGGIDINGVIKQYQVYAGNSISAGDFVHYLKDNFITNTMTSAYSGSYIGCGLLDSTRVFVAFHNSSDNRGYGCIVSINGSSIAVGTITILTNRAYGFFVSVAVMSPTRVIIASSWSNTGTGIGLSLYGVSGTAITFLMDTLPYSSYYSTETQMIPLDSTRALLIFRGAAPGGSTDPLCGAVVTYNSDLSISVGTMYTLLDMKYSGSYIQAIKVSTNKVFIMCGAPASYVLVYGIVASMSGNVISVGSPYAIGSSAGITANTMSAVLLSENVVFFANKEAGKYYAQILNISGNTLSIGTLTLLGSYGVGGGHHVACAKISSSSVIIFSDQTNSSGVAVPTYCIVDINGTTLTSRSVNLFNSSISGITNSCCVNLTASRALLFFFASSGIYDSDTDSAGNYVELATASTNGGAAGDGTAGDTIDVYIPAYAAT